MIEINMLGAVSVAQAVVPIMKKQHSGYIINLASNAGKFAGAVYGVYSISKFGIVGFSDALFRELLDEHIRVTAICRSIVDTDISVSFDYPNDEKIQTKDIVNTVNYCLSLSENARIKDLTVLCRAVVARRST